MRIECALFLIPVIYELCMNYTIFSLNRQIIQLSIDRLLDSFSFRNNLHKSAKHVSNKNKNKIKKIQSFWSHSKESH